MDEQDYVPPAETTPVPAALLAEHRAVVPETGEGMRAVVPHATAPYGFNKDGSPRKRRGRPPGSRNRVKEGDEPIRGATSAMAIPPGRRVPTEDETEAKKSEREKKTAKLEAWFTGEVSEDLLSVVIAATGVPQELIFKQGKAPIRFATNDNLTPIGQAFSIPSDVAHYWSKVIVAVGETESGKKLTGAVESGNAGLILAALMAVASTIRWGQQVRAAMDQLRQFAEQQAQAAQKAAEQNA